MDLKTHKIVKVTANSMLPTDDKIIANAEKIIAEWTEKGWELVSVSMGTGNAGMPIALVTFSFDGNRILNA